MSIRPSSQAPAPLPTRSLPASRLRRLGAGAAAGALLCLLGCGVPQDGVYSLPLAQEPTEADWAAAVPLRVQAVGGRTSRGGLGEVDEDAVHKATASCHHGTQASPVPVEIRAYHTGERLFLRFVWADPTPDLGPSWEWDGAGWRAGGPAQDGLGVLWGESPGAFSCARACHLEDWRMAGPRAIADYRMAAPAGEPPLDFWIWRPGRGTPEGLAEDGRLGPGGWEGDGPGELFGPNSVRAISGKPDAFGPGDRPWEAPPPEPGARAPGHRLVISAPGRLEVQAAAHRRRGTWVLTLSRGFTGSDPGDVRFAPGTEAVFGLAVLDGVDKDHVAVPVPIRLVLVDPPALLGRPQKE